MTVALEQSPVADSSSLPNFAGVIAKVVASFMNDKLRNVGITATAELNNGVLQVVLECDKSVHKQNCLAFMNQVVDRLQLQAKTSITALMVYGKKTGGSELLWQHCQLLHRQGGVGSTKLSSQLNQAAPTTIEALAAFLTSHQIHTSTEATLQTELEEPERVAGTTRPIQFKSVETVSSTFLSYVK